MVVPRFLFKTFASSAPKQIAGRLRPFSIDNCRYIIFLFATVNLYTKDLIKICSYAEIT